MYRTAYEKKLIDFENEHAYLLARVESDTTSIERSSRELSENGAEHKSIH